MIWLTGDTHGHFERIEAFCREKQTTVDDILIILGDAGFNFGGGARDLALKTYASQFPITIFSLHGNRENRPQNIPGYGEGTFCGGKIAVSEFAVRRGRRGVPVRRKELSRRRRSVLHGQGLQACKGNGMVAGRAAVRENQTAR